MDAVRKTKSLCPVCLEKIEAEIIEDKGSMYMVKTCPEHGFFKTVVWREDAEKYLLEGIRQDATLHRLFFELGRIYQKRNDSEKAMQAYFRALQLIYGEDQE